MKSTFIMAEIKIICKMGSFIHVFKCISAKTTGKIRLLQGRIQTSANVAHASVRELRIFEYQYEQTNC